jgi:hypothetical protein
MWIIQSPTSSLFPAFLPSTRAKSKLLNVAFVPPRVKFYTALPVALEAILRPISKKKIAFVRTFSHYICGRLFQKKINVVDNTLVKKKKNLFLLSSYVLKKRYIYYIG